MIISIKEAIKKIQEPKIRSYIRKRNQQFVLWVEQFCAVTEEIKDGFLSTIFTEYSWEEDVNLSLHEMKRLFAEKYQDRIEFFLIDSFSNEPRRGRPSVGRR